MEFSRVFRSLVDVDRILRRKVGISRNLTLVEFSGIPGLVEFDRFFRYRVDSYRNFRLVDYSEFFRF